MDSVTQNQHIIVSNNGNIWICGTAHVSPTIEGRSGYKIQEMPYTVFAMALPVSEIDNLPAENIILTPGLVRISRRQ